MVGRRVLIMFIGIGWDGWMYHLLAEGVMVG